MDGANERAVGDLTKRVKSGPYFEGCCSLTRFVLFSGDWSVERRTISLYENVRNTHSVDWRHASQTTKYGGELSLGLRKDVVARRQSLRAPSSWCIGAIGARLHGGFLSSTCSTSLKFSYKAKPSELESATCQGGGRLGGRAACRQGAPCSEPRAQVATTAAA